MSFTEKQAAAIAKAAKNGYPDAATAEKAMAMLRKNVGWLDCNEFTNALLESCYGFKARSVGNSAEDSARIKAEADATMAAMFAKYLGDVPVCRACGGPVTETKYSGPLCRCCFPPSRLSYETLKEGYRDP